MPTPVTRYRCNVCQTEHDTEDLAVACEARWSVPALPRGVVVFDVEYMGTLMLQVTAGEYVPPPGRAHHLVKVGGCWTFRDPIPGYPLNRTCDTFDPTYLRDSCQPAREGYFGDDSRDWRNIPVDPSTPRYHRAYAALRDAGFPMHVIASDGSVVPAPPPTEKPACVECVTMGAACRTHGHFRRAEHVSEDA